MEAVPYYPIFPSLGHQKVLRHGLRSGAFNSWSNEDRYYWHAYDYAWRRWKLHDARLRSPIDPEGKWYDEPLIEMALEYFTADAPRRMARIEPQWETEARAHREAWAKAHGVENFEQALQIGLQQVGRRAQDG